MRRHWGSTSVDRWLDTMKWGHRTKLRSGVRNWHIDTKARRRCKWLAARTIGDMGYLRGKSQHLIRNRIVS